MKSGFVRDLQSYKRWRMEMNLASEFSTQPVKGDRHFIAAS